MTDESNHPHALQICPQCKRYVFFDDIVSVHKRVHFDGDEIRRKYTKEMSDHTKANMGNPTESWIFSLRWGCEDCAAEAEEAGRWPKL